MKNIENIPSWDLSDLFSSVSDPKIEVIINETSKRAKNFKEKYRDKLAAFSEPSQLLPIIKEYESILSDAIKPQAYAELTFTVDSLSPANGAFLQNIRTKVAEIISELIFFELEITKFSEDVFSRLIDSEMLVDYKHYFERLLVWKPFRLSEAEERVMEMKGLTGRQAFVRLFDQELSRQKFQLTIDGKIVQMTQSEILNILYSNKNQENRAQAAKSFTKGLIQKEDVLTFVMNTLAEDKKIEDSLRGFTFPEQDRHLKNQASPESIEAMCRIVEKFYGLVQQYYVFKKEVLGLEKIFDYDRYAPLKTSGKKYSFEEAREIVLSAFEEFDPRFAEIAQDFFDKNWIDASVSHGKRGGAYCECATPEMHPYVFVNFTGSTNDVMTLAHELGHAIHFHLSRKQSVVNFDCPLTLAETASIFAETLTFSKLVSISDDKNVQLGLYMQKIESIFASVQRQISMYRFEQDFHNEYREKGELSKERINQIWRSRQQQMFGDSIVLTEGYDNWWKYIAHFTATPFYVYAYAFGELLAFGLIEKMKENPQKLIENYREFLEYTGSRTPQQLASLFEINLESNDFWESGMKTIQQYISKAKELYLKS